jgi:ubiquitin-conjugating enzyme E2 W
MQSSLPPGISIVKADDFEEWQMDIRVLDSNPLYLNETYRLKFTFGKNYPIGTVNLSFPFPLLSRPRYRAEPKILLVLLTTCLESRGP